MRASDSCFQCPACGSSIRLVVGDYVGREVTCPTCSSQLQVGKDGLAGIPLHEGRAFPLSTVGVLAAAVLCVAGLGLAIRAMPTSVQIREVPKELAVRAPQDFDALDALPEPAKVQRKPEWGDIPDVQPESEMPAGSGDEVIDTRFGLPLNRRPVVKASPNLDDGESSAAIDRMDNKPIVVPMAIWDAEALPILPGVDGGLEDRTLQRLALQTVSFQTQRPVTPMVVLSTLMDLAGVEWSVESPLPNDKIAFATGEMTIAMAVDELLSKIGYRAIVDEAGVVRVTLL